MPMVIGCGSLLYPAWPFCCCVESTDPPTSLKNKATKMFNVCDILHQDAEPMFFCKRVPELCMVRWNQAEGLDNVLNFLINILLFLLLFKKSSHEDNLMWAIVSYEERVTEDFCKQCCVGCCSDEFKSRCAVCSVLSTSSFPSSASCKSCDGKRIYLLTVWTDIFCLFIFSLDFYLSHLTYALTYINVIYVTV